MILSLLLPWLAFSQVPYKDLERLRQLSVVTRVAVDVDGKLKKCPAGETATLGQTLQAEMDKASGAWAEMKILPAETALLRKKIEACESRGSCQVYATFLEKAEIPDSLKPLQTDLAAHLTKIESASYAKALDSVKDPCGKLKRLRN